jgi:hypothetical protein
MTSLEVKDCGRCGFRTSETMDVPVFDGIRLDQRQPRLFFVVQFGFPAFVWCGDRDFYKSGSESRAQFASSGDGYARLKSCADGLSKILALLESPCGEFDRALARSRVSEVDS